MKIQHWYFFKRHPEHIHPLSQIPLKKEEKNEVPVNRKSALKKKLRSSSSEQNILSTCLAGHSVRNKIHDQFTKRMELIKNVKPTSIGGRNSFLHRRANQLVMMIEETVKDPKVSKLSSYLNTMKSNNFKTYRVEPLKLTERNNELKEQLEEISAQLDNTLDLSCVTQRPRRSRKERLIRNYKTSVLQDKSILNNTELLNNPFKVKVTKNSSNKDVKYKNNKANKMTAKENMKTITKIISKNNLKTRRMAPEHKRCLTQMSLVGDKGIEVGIKVKGQVKPKSSLVVKKGAPKHQYKKSMQTNYLTCFNN